MADFGQFISDNQGFDVVIVGEAVDDFVEHIPDFNAFDQDVEFIYPRRRGFKQDKTLKTVFVFGCNIR